MVRARLMSRASRQRIVRRLSVVAALAVAASGVGPLGPGAAGASTFTFAAEADAHVVEARPDRNFGTAVKLVVGDAPGVQSYLRFRVQAVDGPVRSARLRLYVSDATVDGPAVYPSAVSWSERTITWSNRPGRTGGLLDDVGPLSKGSWAEFDVGGVVSGDGTYSFNLAGTSGDAAQFHSSDHAKNRPQLLVETGTANGDTTPPETTIDSGPSGQVEATTASFTFSADEAGATFDCRLDTGSFSDCASPKTYSGLALGEHTFSVRAVDSAGNVDPTPATRTWTVVGAGDGGSPRDALLAPPTGAHWGAHHKVKNSAPAQDQQLEIETFEAAVGRTLGIDMWYEPWGNAFPKWRETWDLAAGRTPMISWGKTKTTDITAGKHDAYIANRADGLKALGKPVFLRWFWEMDGTRNADVAVSPAAYIDAWRYLRTVFAERGVTNVAWVWCPNASGFEDGSAQQFYPGDDWVDWVCADGYNWYPSDGRAHQSFEEKFVVFHDWAAARGKPAMAGEYGSQEMEEGRRATWISEARESLKTRLTGMLAVVYFHSYSSDYDWQLTSEPDALAAFVAMGADPYFNP
jgi:hypothetical protein